MQSIFDPHINSMLKKIREQLDFVRVKAYGEPQVVSVRPQWHRISSLMSGTALLDTLGWTW
jgi:hypothetical protein